MPSSLPSLKLVERLRLVRIEKYGLSGTAEIARELGIPEQTWCNYERGVTVPGELLLRFIVLTSVDPEWLADGVGPVTRRSSRCDYNPFPPIVQISGMPVRPSQN
jgi:hypothetical protein